MGGAVVSTGGAVSNTGIALHRLGVPVGLIGKVGKDPIGRAILDVLRENGKGLAAGMAVRRGEHSSYTLVISPPGVDRIFLHCPGCNDTFSARDVETARLRGARIFHFGYPSLMRGFYRDPGEMVSLLKRVKKLGLTVSMDMAKPDPEAESAGVLWNPWLKRVLPYVDLFLPSLDEILFMTDKPAYRRFINNGGKFDGALLRKIADRFLDFGAAAVVLKLGDKGIYLRTSKNDSRLRAMGRCAPPRIEDWLNRELLAPCFRVKVVGTTGSGDCAIAGFLTGLLKGYIPEKTMTGAAAVGACNVERADASSGIPSWDKVWKRVGSGWKRLPLGNPLAGFKWDKESGIYRGPEDSK